MLLQGDNSLWIHCAEMLIRVIELLIKDTDSLFFSNFRYQFIFYLFFMVLIGWHICRMALGEKTFVIGLVLNGTSEMVMW